MLQHLEATLDDWAQPLWAALYASSETRAAESLSVAEAALSTLEAPDSDRGALNLFIRHLRLERDLYFARKADGGESTAAVSALLKPALDQLSRLDPSSPVGQVMHARLLFILRCMADRDELRPHSRQEALDLWSFIPQEDRDLTLWSWASCWAFRQGHGELLFEAYTEFLVRRKPQLTRYNWERMRLMYLLSTGGAIFRDVESVIDKFPHITQARLFARFIKPRCEESEIWDERLQMKLELRQYDLDDREQEPLPFRAPRFTQCWDGLELDARRSAEASGTDDQP